jgi:hypothetical protein
MSTYIVKTYASFVGVQCTHNRTPLDIFESLRWHELIKNVTSSSIDVTEWNVSIISFAIYRCT